MKREILTVTLLRSQREYLLEARPVVGRIGNEYFEQSLINHKLELYS
jgi:hypothetical protein